MCPQILYVEKCIYSRLFKEAERNVITWAYLKAT